MRNLRPIAALLFFAVLCVLLPLVSSNRGAATSLPVAQWAVSDGWADEEVCADCHFEHAEFFWQTGHAQTLHRADAADSIELLERLSEEPPAHAERLSVDLDETRIEVGQNSEERSRQLKLDWCFGSGEHARTWVGTLPDSWGERDLVEFRWTWFHQLDGFGITPGQPARTTAGYYADLGLLYDTPKARLCFSCHSTVLPEEDGHTRFDRVQAGVTCQRCHGPRQQHVESEGETQEGFWRTASQLESIHRCGECHRIAEDQEPGTIDPSNAEIVRFQPVGLVQSLCFLGSNELTCLTCHDPHRPLSQQNSTGLWQCVQCHDGTKEKHALCAAGHFDDCLTCHMPKVKTMDNLEFTDHWIRIRNTPPSIRP